MAPQNAAFPRTCEDPLRSGTESASVQAVPTIVWTMVRCSARSGSRERADTRPRSTTCPARTIAAASTSRSPARTPVSPPEPVSAAMPATARPAARKNRRGSDPPRAASAAGVRMMARLISTPAFTALVPRTPQVSRASTAACVVPSSRPALSSARVTRWRPVDREAANAIGRHATADRAYRANSTTGTGPRPVAIFAAR